MKQTVGRRLEALEETFQRLKRMPDVFEPGRGTGGDAGGERGPGQASQPIASVEHGVRGANGAAAAAPRIVACSASEGGPEWRAPQSRAGHAGRAGRVGRRIEPSSTEFESAGARAAGDPEEAAERMDALTFLWRWAQEIGTREPDGGAALRRRVAQRALEGGAFDAAHAVEAMLRELAPRANDTTRVGHASAPRRAPAAPNAGRAATA